jgi:hypothetical protein
MKNNRTNQLIKAVLFVTAITISSLVNAASAHDGDKTKNGQMDVQMKDPTNSEIIVEVKISNEDAKRLVLVIENERGDELFSKEIDKAGLSYRLRFPKDNNIPEYIIKLKEGARSLEQYKITTTSRVVEDVKIFKM